MRAFSVFCVVFLFASLLAIPSAVAQQRASERQRGHRQRVDRQSEQPSPPAPPLPWAGASIREPIALANAVTALDAPGSPSDTTVFLPLSVGLSVVSLPMRIPSETLSDIFPNLPEGSRAWVWDGVHQKFVEGLENELPLGHACWLYVPVPVVLAVTGSPNTLQNVSFDLEPGWNLIGVPYGMALPRYQQHVYVDWARKPFNDAVAANEVDPLIFTYDVNGYEMVAEDGSFEPLRGYWVYARGAELLEFERPGLSDLPFTIPWGSVLSAVGSQAASMIMTQMGYGDTAKLIQILGKLDDIAYNQAALSAKVDKVFSDLALKESEILQAIGDATYVGPVQDALDSYYDQKNPLISFAWFLDQAGAGTVAEVMISNGGTGYTSAPTVTFSAAPAGGTTATGKATILNGAVTGVTIPQTGHGNGYTTAPAITFSGGGGSGATAVATMGATMKARSDFAKAVLSLPSSPTDYKIIEKFNLIKGGISPASAGGKGLLDNFADQVVLTSSRYDLGARYVAMEAYFSKLLGMQIKCATLIMNAYDQLANDPDSTEGFTSQTGPNWKRNVFDKVMKEETQRFLQAVEGIAVRKLPVPQTWNDPPVKVPDDVQMVLGWADSYVMQTLGGIYPDLEPPGVRLRFMLNPGAGVDLPTVSWLRSDEPRGTPPHTMTLPSFDTWRTVAGAGEYDDWVLPKDSNARAFNVTSNWKIARVILPVFAPATVTIRARGSSTWWRTNEADFQVSAFLAGGVFGSFTSARRPSTVDAFHPCMGWGHTTEITHYCDVRGDCDWGDVSSCSVKSLHPTDVRSSLTVTYDFIYQGNVPKTSTWRANGVGAVDDNMKCSWGWLTYGLLKGTNTPLGANIWGERPGGVLSIPVTWEPGQTYKFQVVVQPDRVFTPNQCVFYWSYQGVFMTFP